MSNRRRKPGQLLNLKKNQTIPTTRSVAADTWTGRRAEIQGLMREKISANVAISTSWATTAPSSTYPGAYPVLWMNSRK